VAGNLHVSVAMDDLFSLPETQADMRSALRDSQTRGGNAFMKVCLAAAPGWRSVRFEREFCSVSLVKHVAAAWWVSAPQPIGNITISHSLITDHQRA